MNHGENQCNETVVQMDNTLTSGVAATLFSKGYVSFGTPTVNLE